MLITDIKRIIFLAVSALALGCLSLSAQSKVDLTSQVRGVLPLANGGTNNTSGTATNLTGTPALPNGTTATTQSQADGTAKLATDSYVDTGLATKQNTLALPLSPTNGGTGQDTHTSTGLAQVASGVWSVSTALANGTTATTQSQADGSTKVATTSYVDTGLATKQASLTGTGIARNTGASSELSGDVTTSGSNATTVGKIGGVAVISNTTFTTSTSTVNANTCSGSTTVTMTGTLTTSVFDITPNADTSAVTGWGSSGGLILDAWPTSNTLNYKICNQTAGNITPGAVTFNVGAR